MKLNNQELINRKKWEELGYELPNYDRGEMILETRKAPGWVHFGAGNLFRAYPAKLVQSLLNMGKTQKGIIVVEAFEQEIIEKVYEAHDYYSILVTLKSDWTMQKTIIGSVADACFLQTDWEKLKDIFTNPSLQIASFTITEKGYQLKDEKGVWKQEVLADFGRDPKQATTFMGKVAALMYERYMAHSAPLALVSLDNCARNGERLYDALAAYANNWEKSGFVNKGFYQYLASPKVSFPWTMIDKITPRPDKKVEETLVLDGLSEIEAFYTQNNSLAAPYVNAEEKEYLVIEDVFPNGRPRLEETGVIFTDRRTVNLAEKMKVGTCLNPLHTALAVFGCLLGYKRISEEMEDATLRRLVEKIGYEEGLPVVEDPKVIDPKAFLRDVISERLSNGYMPDTPQRIAMDTSQKLAVRFGGTLEKYAKTRAKEILNLVGIPLVIAGWLRYLMGLDDSGETMELSSDPRLGELVALAKDIDGVRKILRDDSIFGVKLEELLLVEKIMDMYLKMCHIPGGVRNTLEEYIGKETV